MAKNQSYDYAWTLYGNEDAKFQKQQEWVGRDWVAWLTENLSYPFLVERVQSLEELEQYGYLYDQNDYFGYGHSMKVLNIHEVDAALGIIVKVRESRRVGYVPLAQLQVTPRKNRNYWPVREYAVWFKEQTQPETP